jgi:hypothetical protein
MDSVTFACVTCACVQVVLVATMKVAMKATVVTTMETKVGEQHWYSLLSFLLHHSVY